MVSTRSNQNEFLTSGRSNGPQPAAGHSAPQGRPRGHLQTPGREAGATITAWPLAWYRQLAGSARTVSQARCVMPELSGSIAVCGPCSNPRVGVLCWLLAWPADLSRRSSNLATSTPCVLPVAGFPTVTDCLIARRRRMSAHPAAWRFVDKSPPSRAAEWLKGRMP